MTPKFLLTLFGLDGLTVSGMSWAGATMRPVLLLLLSAPAAGGGDATASGDVTSKSVKFQKGTDWQNPASR